MKSTTTQHGKFQQTRAKMLRSEWLETYRPMLVSERELGNVFGWTCIPSDNWHIVVIVSHK